MGLLTVGEPLSWPETKSYAEYVRQHGIKQFIILYQLCKSKTSEVLKFGDEIEYMVVKFDDDGRKVRVSNRALPILKTLQEPEDNQQDCSSLWRPEFGAYMVEGTPGQPYSMNPTALEQYLMTSGGDGAPETMINGLAVTDVADLQTPATHFSFLNVIESNMRLRRKQVQSLLEPDEAVLSICAFPMLGCRDFCHPPAFVHPTYGYSRSLFFPDEAIYGGHPRFRTLANNIRERRGKNVEIFLPIYSDRDTVRPFREDLQRAMNVDPDAVTPDEYRSYCHEAKKRQTEVLRDDQVYMDAMGFGMGCCCLQVTFQASNLNEAFVLYDQLAPLCPIMMAMSAASPVFRGYLVDVDCRWSVIAQSVDDRTEAEITGRDPRTGEKCRRIPKSRFDSIDLYISPENDRYNDLDVVYDERYYEEMINNQIPHSLAKHIAHLFIRDPLVIFKEKLDIDDTKESDHFENIQSTNWQTMRFKPPPLSAPEIGWRVEFRPMELQLTDEENAAFVIFIVLLTRLILSFNLDLLIPMSKVEENMREAQKRDAVKTGRFWFRRDIFFPQKIFDHIVRKQPKCAQMCKCLSPEDQRRRPLLDAATINTCCVQLTIDEIINGTDDRSEGRFPGLIPLLNFYLDSVEIDAEMRCTLHRYLRLISRRAAGKLPTAARMIRDYVTAHPEYRHDSRVTDAISYDLLHLLNQLQTEQITLEQFVQIIQKEDNTKQK